jgi:hypothetical protein
MMKRDKNGLNQWWPRANSRRLLMGLRTILGLKRQGFFIPYRHAGGITQSDEQRGAPGLEPLFQRATPRLLSVLDSVLRYRRNLAAIGATGEPPEPRWQQDWFPGLDAAAAYVLVRRHRPRQIIEIGSGHSTRFFARAVRDGHLGTEITAIDPAPRASLKALTGVRWYEKVLQRVTLAELPPLQAGDIVFFDSSHIAMPGTDLDVVFGTWLPDLPAGVLVHFHDSFLPDPYPSQWGWRGYNEHQALAALLAGGGYELLFSSAYGRRLVGRLDALPYERWPNGPPESSLWLLKI